MNLLLPLLFLATTGLALEANQAPAKLPGSAWQVTTFAGEATLAEHPINFEFDAEGNIAGNASCNRFGGACTIDGSTVRIGPLRSTRRACEPEVMRQEQKFLALLGAAQTWEITSDGILVLNSPEGEIKASGAPAELTPQP